MVGSVLSLGSNKTLQLPSWSLGYLPSCFYLHLRVLIKLSSPYSLSISSTCSRANKYMMSQQFPAYEINVSSETGSPADPHPDCCHLLPANTSPQPQNNCQEQPAWGSIRSDQISRSVVSDSLQPHESQQARPPCPSPTPGVH